MRSPLALILFGDEHPPHPGRPSAAPVVPRRHDDETGPRSEPPVRRARRLRLLAVLGAAVALLAACGPGAAPAPPSPSEAIIREVFDPIGEGDKAVSVASCESGLNPGAIGGGGTYQGLFQLGPNIVAVHAYGGDRLDARQNALAARDLRVQRGNWSAWPHCGRR